MGCIELVTLGSQPRVHGLGLVPGWSAASIARWAGSTSGTILPDIRLLFVVSWTAQMQCLKAMHARACLVVVEKQR